jgi:hypothetical protein
MFHSRKLSKEGLSDTLSLLRVHITWIVWEKVPGKRLGDYKSAFVYWDMDSEQRKRASSQTRLRGLAAFGKYPIFLAALIIMITLAFPLVVERCVWEKVPGKRLGDYKSAFVYWDMDSEQRKRVREAPRNYS